MKSFVGFYKAIFEFENQKLLRLSPWQGVFGAQDPILFFLGFQRGIYLRARRSIELFLDYGHQVILV